ncbi:MAG: hypothetical protein IJF67_08240 [Clostridia bacterium]|nr:hypothetical protein [Clostridia bacterium]
MDEKEILAAAALTEAQRAEAEASAAAIALDDPTEIIVYGAACQKKAAEIADRVFARVQQAEEENADIAALTETIFAYPGEDGGWFSRLLGRGKHRRRKKEALAAADKLAEALELRRNRLLEAHILYERLYTASLEGLRELNFLIHAGKFRLQSEKSDAFEKKLHDLSLSHTLGVQTAVQLKLLQTLADEASARVGTVLDHMLPLLKNQLTLGAGLHTLRQTERELAAAMREIQTEPTEETGGDSL